MIVVVDYGMGNNGSILNMLKKIAVPSICSPSAEHIENATKLILPGVGAFDKGMANLRSYGLLPLIARKCIEERTPILGICLGMQLFSTKSEEGSSPGLGWIDAETVRFNFNGDQRGSPKIPHMGWNTINVMKDNPLFTDMNDESRFYFIHSYHVQCNNVENVIATTSYGYNFTSAVMKDNIYGVQFHPEKSHKFGIKLLSNFSSIG